MQTTQISCPYCGSALNFAQEIAAGAPVECLICMRSFAAPAHAARPAPKPVTPGSAAKETPKKSATPSPAPAAPKLVTPTLPAPKPTAVRAAADAEAGRGLMLAFAIVLLVLITAGVSFAIWRAVNGNKGPGSDDSGQLLAANAKEKDDPAKKNSDADSGKKEKEPEKKEPPEPKDKIEIKPDPPKIDEEPEVKDPPKKDKEDPKLVRKNPPKIETKDPDPEPPPITKVPIIKKRPPAGNQGRIDTAIDKGLDFLKKKQQADGSWGYGGGHPVGFAALCALTMLESKVPAKDSSIQRAADYVRSKAEGLDKNYEAGTAILFLDRLGDERDRPLIQSLALRLLASQGWDGGWNYTLQPLSGAESQQLLEFLQSQKLPEAKRIRPGTLSATLRVLPIVRNQGKAKGKHTLVGGGSDNSNTQFALLALWAARRHEVPGDQAILFAYDRFNQTQNSDGGWPYEPNRGSSNAMTCVGLLGLAMGHGISPDIDGKPPDDPKKVKTKPVMEDPKVKKGMEALSRYIGKLSDGPPGLGSENLYFMWSLERVGVLYNLDEIEGKDWYAWGANMLIAQQVYDGTFPSAMYINQEPTANTCFALLFLNRSNLVQDLTVELQLRSGIRDPGR